jgi:predicted transcriptional regulator
MSPKNSRACVFQSLFDGFIREQGREPDGDEYHNLVNSAKARSQNILRPQKVELRRIRPKDLGNGTLTLIYVTSPVKSLAGAFRVTHVIEKPLADLWKVVQKKAGLTYREFRQYYDGVSTGTAIFFQKVWTFREPLSLEDLRNELLTFLPPRAFRYAKIDELQAPRIVRLLSTIC